MEIIIIMLTGFFLFVAEGELYRRLWSRGLDAKVEISPTQGFIGDKCSLKVTLSNRKSLPLPWLRVKLHVSSALVFSHAAKETGENTYLNALFCIMGWQEIERTLYFVCSKRGYYPLRSFEITGTSILFNGKHSKSFSAPCALTVYPQLLDRENESLNRLLLKLDGLTAYRGFLNPDPFEFAGIREYIPSDSFKDINFKASARMGSLMTNTHNPTVKGDITLYLCFKSLKQGFEEERFEYAVSLAATLAEYFTDSGFSAALYANCPQGSGGDPIAIEGGIGSGHLQVIYEALARADYKAACDVSYLTPLSYSTSNAIFISPTVDMPILDLYRTIEENHTSALWLYPTMEFDAPRTAPPADTAEVLPVPAGFGASR